MTACSGAVSVGSSSRTLIISTDGVDPMRRPAYRSKSSVASSAQCRSSNTTTCVLCRNSATNAANTSRVAAPLRSASRSWPPSSAATSRRGASGLGVVSGSHAPHPSQALERTVLVHVRSRLVFPIPASPWTRTTEPSPRRASASRSSSAANAASRSMSFIRMSLVADIRR